MEIVRNSEYVHLNTSFNNSLIRAKPTLKEPYTLRFARDECISRLAANIRVICNTLDKSMIFSRNSRLAKLHCKEQSITYCFVLFPYQALPQREPWCIVLYVLDFYTIIFNVKKIQKCLKRWYSTKYYMRNYLFAFLLTPHVRIVILSCISKVSLSLILKRPIYRNKTCTKFMQQIPSIGRKYTYVSRRIWSKTAA